MSNRKPYVEQQKTGWWLKNPFFIRYMIREGTSLFTAAYSILLICGLLALIQGEQAFTGWLRVLASPMMIVFHCLALVSTLIHTATWFKLTPKLLPIQLGEFKVPDSWMQAAQYISFAVASLLIVLLAMGALAI